MVRRFGKLFHTTLGFPCCYLYIYFYGRSFSNWSEIERLLELGESYDEVLNRRYDKNRFKKLMENARLESNTAYVCFFTFLLTLSLGANWTYAERVGSCRPNLITGQSVGHGSYYDDWSHTYKNATDCIYDESRLKNMYDR